MKITSETRINKYIILNVKDDKLEPFTKIKIDGKEYTPVPLYGCDGYAIRDNGTESYIGKELIKLS